jgi:MFS family permease
LTEPVLSEKPSRSIIPRNVLVLTLSRTVWSMSDTNVDNFISLYMISMGATIPLIGLINALGNFGAMLLYPIGGYIADKSGRVRLVSLSTLLYVASFVIYLLAPSWQWAAVAMIYQCMVLFYTPAMNAVMADSIPVGKRGKLYAFNFALPNIIKIVSPYLGGLFIARYDVIPAMRIGFGISFLIGVFVATVRFTFLRETLIDIERVNWDPVNLFSESYQHALTSLRWVWTNLRSYTILSMLLAFLSSLILPFWLIYAIQAINIQPYEWAVILLWSGVAKAVLSFFIGGIVDVLGSRKCFLIGFLLAIPGMFSFSLAKGFWMTMALYTLIVFSSVFMWIASQVYLADSTPREIRGRVMAGLGSGTSIGVTGVGVASGFIIFLPKTLGSLAGGYIYDFNPVAPWIVQSIFLGLGLLFTYFTIRDPTKPYE